MYYTDKFEIYLEMFILLRINIYLLLKLVYKTI